MLHILHFLAGRFTGDSASGVEKAVYSLVKSQVDLGCEVSVFCVSPFSSEWNVENGARVKYFKGRKNSFVCPKELVKEVKRLHPTVIHIHGTFLPINYALSRWARCHRVPYVVTPHGNTSPSLLLRRWYIKVPYFFAFERSILCHASFIHSVGDSREIEALRLGTEVVYAANAVNFEEIPAVLDFDGIRRRFQVGEADKIILFLGRLDVEQKGLDILVDAFASIVSKRSDIFLFLVGPDWRGGQKRLKKLCSDRGIAAKVIFWGPAFGQEKFDLLAACDVFVHLSRWEGHPISVLEALSMGKACVVSRGADLGGMVQMYGAGQVVELGTGKVVSVLQGICGLSREELSRIGERGKRLVAKEYSWGKTAKLLDEAYRRLVRK